MSAPGTSNRFSKRARTLIVPSGELVDAAIGLYRRGGLDLFRAILVPSAVAFGMIVLAWSFVTPYLLDTEVQTGSALQEAWQLGLLLFFGVICTAPVVISAVAWMSAMVSAYASQLRLGMRPNVAAIRRLIFRRLGGLTFSSILVTLYALGSTLISFVLLMISAVLSDHTSGDLGPYVSFLAWLGLLLSPIVFALVFSRVGIAPIVLLHENVGARQSIRRSITLLRTKPATKEYSQIGLLFLCLLVYFAIVEAASLPVAWIVDLLHANSISEANLLMRTLYQMLIYLNGFIGFLLVMPILVCGQTLIYFDRRAALEGLDIEFLAQEVWKRGRKIDFDL
jgi:hypothetical protein